MNLIKVAYQEMNFMKVVILAGGYGTRISEESYLKPKPMIEIGGQPILWHIMKTYSYYGYNDFIICCGYKANVIKEYFSNYYLHMSDVTFDFSDNNSLTIHKNIAEPWRVTVVDTGLETLTGGRIKKVKDYIGESTFMLTYGDGVCDINIKMLEEFHKNHGKIATLTAIQPDGRFGVLNMDNNGVVNNFSEKNREDSGWINGGFMVLEPEVMNYIDGDNTNFENQSLKKLAAEGELIAYKYDGFWQCMDTVRDKKKLEGLIADKKAPWIKG